MKAGRMKQKLNFMRASEEKGGLGQRMNEILLATCRSEVKYQSGKEFVSSGAGKSEGKVLIRVRSQSAIADLSALDWIVDDRTGQRFNIVFVPPSMRGEIEIQAVTK